MSNYAAWDLYSLGRRWVEWAERLKNARDEQQRRSYTGELKVIEREFDRKFLTGPYWPSPVMQDYWRQRGVPPTRDAKGGDEMSGIAEGEVVLDSKKVADMVRRSRDFWHALRTIEGLEDYHAEVTVAIERARQALAAEPEFDAIPDYVQVDSSWADTLPVCVECGKDVPWAEALLMPCSTVEGGEADTLGIVHRQGCETVRRAQPDVSAGTAGP